MKQSLPILCIVAALCANTVFAGTQLVSHKKFTQQHWFSSGQKDVITIQANTDAYLTRVFITVGDGTYNHAHATGINIKGCGNVSHVNAGSSVICELSSFNPILGLAADQSTEEFVAYGTVEIA